MLAVFHIAQPDGAVVATCGTYPNWACVSKTLGESKRRSVESLREHILADTTFAHYEVPILNETVRAAA